MTASGEGFAGGFPSPVSPMAGPPSADETRRFDMPEDAETCSEASFMSSNDDLPEEERLALAVSLKDAGNSLFKETNYEEALSKYKEGEKRLKNATNSEAIAVYVQLSSNSCMCCLKLNRWRDAIEAANRVLSKEPQNLKALYRRGVARSNVGSLEEAKEDFLAVLAVDSKNADARKSLLSLKEKQDAAKAEDKKAYSRLFSRASGLYDDREAERERKKKAEEAETARRKAEWYKEMEAKKEKGEPEEDFEAWLKRTKEAEDKEREEKQKEQTRLGAPLGGLNQRSKKDSSSKSSSKSSKDSSKSSSKSSGNAMDIDEEDAEIIKETKKMGYCYFRRDLTDEEKRLNANNRPTRINPDDNNASPLAEVSSNQDKDGRGTSISQWNRKGTTYEEKDVSPWARGRFAERLQEAAVSSSNSQPPASQDLLAACLKATEALGKEGTKPDKAVEDFFKSCVTTTIKTCGVEEVSGDAHLAVVRGSRRVFFEMNASVKFAVKCSVNMGVPLSSREDKPDLKEAMGGYESEGTLKLSDVSSADGSGMSWLDGSRLLLDTPLPPQYKPVVDEALKKYKESVAEKIQAFLDDCKALP